MKSKFIKKIIIITLIFFSLVTSHADEFNFDVTEIEIVDKGNIFKGLKRGTVTSNDGVILFANEFAKA